MVHGDYHPLQTEKEKQINAYMPLISALFPGIDYYSISGFSQVQQDYLVPTLKKLFPELIEMSADDVSATEKVEIKEPFLPCKGYEHQDDPKWKERLDELLEAA